MRIPKLRKATQDGKQFAYKVKRAAMREYVELVWGWDEDLQWQLHDRRFQEQDFQIISLGGVEIGIMSVAERPDCLFINQLYVLPEHQGQGVGRKCMLTVMERGRSLGLPVRLQVMRVNPRAVAFYQRLDFTITGETATHVLMQASLCLS